MKKVSEMEAFCYDKAVDENTYNKRRLFSILSWVIIGLYVIMNLGVILTDTPLATMIVLLPIINIVLIGAWLFVRTFYNKANQAIKHGLYLESKTTESPLPTYGKGRGAEYVPNLKVSTELFNSITTEPNNTAVFGTTMKDYLKRDTVIIFHDELNYGSIKKVRVSKVSIGEKEITVSFAQPR